MADYSLRRSGMLLCVVGPAASGKTTIRERLLAANPGTLKVSVSVTSRAMRPGEREGRDYRFLSRADFEERVRDGLFFEWEEVHGQLYGTLRSSVEEAGQSGTDLLLSIDIKGALKVKKLEPARTVVLFLVPPSFAALKQRLLARGPVADEELAARVATARGEYAMLLGALQDGAGIDYLIVNDDLEETCRAAQAVLEAERRRLARQNALDLKRICVVP